MAGTSLLALLPAVALVVALGLLLRLWRERIALAAESATFSRLSGDWSWQQDQDFRFVSFHGDAFARLPIDRQRLYGRACWELDAVLAEPEAMAAHRARCERHEAFREFQFGLRCGDGTIRWLVASGDPLFDRRRRFRGYRGLAWEDSQRILAEQALERSRQQLEAIAAGSPVPMFALDGEGRVILWNRGCEVVLGIAADRMLGSREPWRAFYPEARPVLADCVMSEDPLGSAATLYQQRAHPSESIPGALEAEGFFPALAGRDRWLYFVAAPMRDASGAIVGAVETLQDVTARKLAEDASRLRGAYLSAVIDHLPQGISVFDEQLRLKHWNARICEILDLPASAVHTDARFEEIARLRAERGDYGPGDPAEQVAQRRAMALRFEPHSFERVRRDGRAHLVEGRPMYLDGRIAGFVTTYTDITTRLLNEALLERQRAELEAAQRTAHIGSWRWPAGARRPECSAEMLRLLGLSEGRPVPALPTLLRMARAADRPALRYGITTLLRHGARLDVVCRLDGGHGNDRHLRLIADREWSPDGRPTGYAGVLQDITALRQTEAALQASGEMLTTIFEQGPVPLALVGLDGEELLLANHAWRRQFACGGPEPPGSAFGELGIWSEPGQWPALRAHLADGEPSAFEAVLRGAAGQALVCEISGRVVRVEARALLLASFVDVSEARRIRSEIEALNTRLEERVAQRTAELSAANAHLAQAMDKLVQSEKLAALGGLVAGIAHELNTPLGNAMTVASTLRERVDGFIGETRSGPLRRSALNEFVDGCADAARLIERNVDRAAQQVAHFKQVAVDQTSERRRSFDLRTTLEEIVGAIGPRFKHTAHRVSIEAPAGIRMDSYPGPLEQVIANLIDNALTHAFGGRDQGTVRIAAGTEGPDRVRLEICDDGCGMPPGIRARAFDPFFTTRLGQGGSGLGLYIVYNLVTGMLGGSIALENPRGGGSVFRIELPRSAPAIPRQTD